MLVLINVILVMMYAAAGAAACWYADDATYDDGVGYDGDGGCDTSHAAAVDDV